VQNDKINALQAQLAERVPAPQPAPSVPVIPEDVAEILRDALNYFVKMHTAIRAQNNDGVDPEAMVDVSKAMAWLDSLGEGE
jgi:hypothetical protein